MSNNVKTLFVTNDAPYPPSSGALIRNWLHISAMSELGPVAVFSVGELATNVTDLPTVAAWRHHGHDGRCSTLARIRSNLRRIVHAREFHVTDNRRALKISRSLREFALEFRPDVVVIENWLDAFPRSLLGLSCKIVVDAHNIESILQSDVLRKSESPILIARSYVRRFFASGIERRLFESADEVWLTSKDDLARLRTLTRRAVSCRVIPNSIDVSRYEAVRRGEMEVTLAVPRQRRSICFVGNFQHRPNVLAAEVLIDEILPRLRARFPDARLVLVGRDPSEQMLRAARRDAAVVVTGRVVDTRSYIAACDLTVIPMSAGGGTRLKILEAFASGIPVISTPIGAEGIDVRDNLHLLIRETIDQLVDAATEVWMNPQLAMSLTDRAYSIVKSAYSTSAVSTNLHVAVAQLLDRRAVSACQKTAEAH